MNFFISALGHMVGAHHPVGCLERKRRSSAKKKLKKLQDKTYNFRVGCLRWFRDFVTRDGKEKERVASLIGVRPSVSFPHRNFYPFLFFHSFSVFRSFSFSLPVHRTSWSFHWKSSCPLSFIPNDLLTPFLLYWQLRTNQPLPLQPISKLFVIGTASVNRE